MAQAGSDNDISFLADVSVTESQGTFSKEVSDCGDGESGEQLVEDGVEISIGLSQFCTSFSGELGLSCGKGGKSPCEHGMSLDERTMFSGECNTSGKSSAPLGDCDVLSGDCIMLPGNCGIFSSDCDMSCSGFMFCWYATSCGYNRF